MHCYPAENIVPLLTYCLDPPCLIFQYMESGSLYGKLKSTRNPLNWKQRANIALGISRGLHHLHGNNIVHGDIKSPNILLDKHLEPKIGDFGTVKILYNVDGKETTSLGIPNLSGTAYYLPKWLLEQPFKKSIRKAVDVYSFGIVIFEIMSGRLPSDKDTQNHTLRQFVDTEIGNHPVPPQEYIAPIDSDNRSFQVDTKHGITLLDWPYFLYLIVRRCCLVDERQDNSKPWVQMPTIVQLHQEIDSVTIYSHRNLGEAVITEEETEKSMEEIVKSLQNVEMRDSVS